MKEDNIIIMGIPDLLPPNTFKPSKKKFITIVLPKELFDAVFKLKMGKEGIRQALIFLDLLITYSYQQDDTPTAYVYFSSSHFRNRFNSRYKQWLDLLIEKNIVESDNTWSTRTGKSINYRIHPNVVSDWGILAKKDIRAKNRNYYEPKDLDYLQGVISFFDSLNIDFPELHQVMEECLSKSDDIEKRQHKKVAWVRSLVRLKGRSFYAHRNATNNRLDSNFTGFPNALMDVIIETNHLMEIDAKNCQYAILANLIKDKVFDNFVEDAITGTLYEKVATKIGCDRDTAKDKTMKTIYSKPQVKNKDKTHFRELYPETMEYLESYKFKRSNRDLAIAMQKAESKLFIDGILNEIYKLGILAISKHDSIIFHRKDRTIVEKMVKEVLKSKDYELSIKIK